MCTRAQHIMGADREAFGNNIIDTQSIDKLCLCSLLLYWSDSKTENGFYVCIMVKKEIVWVGAWSVCTTIGIELKGNVLKLKFIFNLSGSDNEMQVCSRQYSFKMSILISIWSMQTINCFHLFTHMHFTDNRSRLSIACYPKLVFIKIRVACKTYFINNFISHSHSSFEALIWFYFNTKLAVRTNV